MRMVRRVPPLPLPLSQMSIPPDESSSISAGRAEQRIRAALNGTWIAPEKDPFDIQSDSLYGAVGGLTLPVPVFELAPGLNLRQTFCHVIAPYIMAFAPPPGPGRPHPGPWTALGEGGLTVEAEVELLSGVAPLAFDRLNTIWFVVALLKLRLGLSLTVPVIADRPYEVVGRAPERCNLIPLELGAPLVRTAQSRAVSQADLQWLRAHLAPAAMLMRDSVFNRAFQTLDRAVAITNPGAGIVIAWAAMEALMRPGQHRITERICRALATMLQPPGSKRDRAFTDIAASYEARGGAAHAGHLPDSKQFEKTFDLARSAITATIEAGQLPDIEDLLRRWSQKV